jgi:hypothetical protein
MLNIVEVGDLMAWAVAHFLVLAALSFASFQPNSARSHGDRSSGNYTKVGGLSNELGRPRKATQSANE